MSEATSAAGLAAAAAVVSAIAAIAAVATAFFQWDATRKQSRVSILNRQIEAYEQLRRTIGSLSLVVTDEDERKILNACDKAIIVFNPAFEQQLTKLMDLAISANIARANRQAHDPNRGANQQEELDNHNLRALWKELQPHLKAELREWREVKHPLTWIDDFLDWIEGKHR